MTGDLRITRLRSEIMDKARRKTNGMTLVELLVVLSILAIMSLVAMRSTSGLLDDSRYQATVTTMEQARIAVVGQPNTRNIDGSIIITGFVADVGRLPRAYAEDDGTLNPLKELITNVNNILPFGTYTSDLDKAIRLTYGWRGPYLQTPVGTDESLDGWGNQFTGYWYNTPSPNVGTLTACRAGEEVEVIRSTGGTEAPYDNNIDLGWADWVDIPSLNLHYKTDSYTSKITGMIRFNDYTKETNSIGLPRERLDVDHDGVADGADDKELGTWIMIVLFGPSPDMQPPQDDDDELLLEWSQHFAINNDDIDRLDYTTQSAGPGADNNWYCYKDRSNTSSIDSELVYEIPAPDPNFMYCTETFVNGFTSSPQRITAGPHAIRAYQKRFLMGSDVITCRSQIEYITLRPGGTHISPLILEVEPWLRQ